MIGGCSIPNVGTVVCEVERKLAEGAKADAAAAGRFWRFLAFYAKEKRDLCLLFRLQYSNTVSQRLLFKGFQLRYDQDVMVISVIIVTYCNYVPQLIITLQLL